MTITTDEEYEQSEYDFSDLYIKPQPVSKRTVKLKIISVTDYRPSLVDIEDVED